MLYRQGSLYSGKGVRHALGSDEKGAVVLVWGRGGAAGFVVVVALVVSRPAPDLVADVLCGNATRGRDHIASNFDTESLT